MWIRRVLAVVVACGLFWSVAGCAFVADADLARKAEELERLVAAEPGVAEVNVSSGPPTESFVGATWAAGVTVAEGLSVERRGELVVRFFELAKQVGLSKELFKGVTFKLPGGEWLRTGDWVDVSVSEVFVMLDWGASLSWAGGFIADVDWESGKWNVRLSTNLDADSTAEFVERATQFITDIPRPTELEMGTLEIEGYIDSGSLYFWVGGVPSAGDLAFFAAVRGWAGRNPDIRFSISISLGGKCSARLFTGDVRPGVVREFAAIVRDHRQACAVTGLTDNGDKYLIIPPP